MYVGVFVGMFVNMCAGVCVCVCWEEISDVYVGMQISGHTRESLILSVYV